MKRALLVMGAVFFCALQAFAQTPTSCNYLITQSGIYSATKLKAQPGQTICVQAGTYNQIRFTDLYGTEEAPIKIINYGGQVAVTGTAYSVGIQFYNCHFFTLTGTGDALTPYGFYVNNSGTGAGSALTVTMKSSDCEIDHTEVINVGFAGMMIKTDPDCDSTTWRGNFTMYNVSIHDNYVHDTGGEGLYIGNSFWSGGLSKVCSGVTKIVYPHEIIGLEVYNNRIERTKAEGIQYGCAPGAKVHHNTLTNIGVDPFSNYQDNGMQMGEGSSGDCYNNVIKNVGSNGLIMVGTNGNVRVFNNLILNVGVDGIFCDNRVGSAVGPYVAILHNNIINAKRDAVRLYNENNVNTVANNILALVVGKYVTLQQGATANQPKNIQTARPDTLGFVDYANGDYNLLSTSRLVNAGQNLASWGVTIDMADQPRLYGTAYDIGAYEYSGNSMARMAAVETETAPLPLYLLATTERPEPDAVKDEILSAFEKAETSSAYPMPCRDWVTIQVPKGNRPLRVQVYSPLGQTLMHSSQLGSGNLVTLATDKLPDGLYTYRIECENSTYTGKFTKN